MKYVELVLVLTGEEKPESHCPLRTVQYSTVVIAPVSPHCGSSLTGVMSQICGEITGSAFVFGPSGFSTHLLGYKHLSHAYITASTALRLAYRPLLKEDDSPTPAVQGP
jgi:hypothetical protein